MAVAIFGVFNHNFDCWLLFPSKPAKLPFSLCFKNMKSNTELSKEDVLYYISIWENWLSGSEPAKNKPIEIRDAEGYESNYKIIIGTIVDISLWILNKFSMLLSLHSTSILATTTRIKINYLTWEPNSCSLNNAYTDLGISYLKLGNIDKSVKCLQKSWKVYPCPHNTTFGLSMRLFKMLKIHTEYQSILDEYIFIRDRFRNI